MRCLSQQLAKCEASAYIRTSRCPRNGEQVRMLSDIYNRRILELAADIPRLGASTRRRPRRLRTPSSAARP